MVAHCVTLVRQESSSACWPHHQNEGPASLDNAMSILRIDQRLSTLQPSKSCFGPILWSPWLIYVCGASCVCGKSSWICKIHVLIEVTNFSWWTAGFQRKSSAFEWLGKDPLVGLHIENDHFMFWMNLCRTQKQITVNFPCHPQTNLTIQIDKTTSKQSINTFLLGGTVSAILNHSNTTKTN